MRFPIRLAAWALLFLPMRAAAQENYFDHLAQKEMGRLIAPWQRLGFQPVTDLSIGLQRRHDRDTLTLQLEHGWQYAVLTMCDEDCGDVDLNLFDASGKRISFEATSNARSLLRITSPPDGTYRLEIVMIKCSTPPCYYAVQLLRGPVTAPKGKRS